MRIAGQPDTRLLEERSRLEFHYPKDNIIIFIPFYENPDITESKSANLVEYNPLGRSSSLFAYTGAKSRKIKLDLKYTLPHLENFSMGPSRFKRLFDDTKADQRLLFTKWSQDMGTRYINSSPSLEAEKRYDRLKQDYAGQVSNLAQTRKRQNAAGVYYDVAMGGEGDGSQSLQVYMAEQGMLETDRRNTKRWLASAINNKKKYQLLDTLIFFINIFRTCVDNDASNPIYGPPLLRLTHGTMYQSIPCICRNVNIEYNQEEWGYDLTTLTPRHVKVSLDLAEVRVGDFGKFEPSTIIKRDNLAGWESVVNEPLTIDPGQLQ